MEFTRKMLYIGSFLPLIGYGKSHSRAVAGLEREVSSHRRDCPSELPQAEPRPVLEFRFGSSVKQFELAIGYSRTVVVDDHCVTVVILFYTNLNSRTRVRKRVVKRTIKRARQRFPIRPDGCISWQISRDRSIGFNVSEDGLKLFNDVDLLGLTGTGDEPVDQPSSGSEVSDRIGGGRNRRNVVVIVSIVENFGMAFYHIHFILNIMAEDTVEHSESLFTKFTFRHVPQAEHGPNLGVLINRYR